MRKTRGVMSLNENIGNEILEEKHFSPRSVIALVAHTGYKELMSTLSGIKSWSN